MIRQKAEAKPPAGGMKMGDRVRLDIPTDI